MSNDYHSPEGFETLVSTAFVSWDEEHIARWADCLKKNYPEGRLFWRQGPNKPWFSTSYRFGDKSKNNIKSLRRTNIYSFFVPASKPAEAAKPMTKKEAFRKEMSWLSPEWDEDPEYFEYDDEYEAFAFTPGNGSPKSTNQKTSSKIREDMHMFNDTARYKVAALAKDCEEAIAKHESAVSEALKTTLVEKAKLDAAFEKTGITQYSEEPQLRLNASSASYVEEVSRVKTKLARLSSTDVSLAELGVDIFDLCERAGNIGTQKAILVVGYAM